MPTSKELLTINPGQFALLLTEEQVKIPYNKIAFISIKAGIKLRGLINVSGFHVDPGYEGNLVFSVYNAGSGPVSMTKGEPYFLLWFVELDVTKKDKGYDGEHGVIDRIPEKYIDSLNLLELASPSTLLDKINKNYNELSSTAKTREYILKTCLGILILIAFKVLWDWGAYDKGAFDGFEAGRNQVEMEIELNDLLDQKKNLLLQIDSLENKKERALNDSLTELGDAEK